MRKYLIYSTLAILGIITVFLIYLSNYGVKTEKFNDLITDKIKTFDPKLSLNINDVFLKINAKEKSININTQNAKLYADNGNTLVELIMSKSHENKKDRDFFTIGASHLAFTVDDLQKTYEYLLKNGIKFNAPPQSPPDGKAKVTFCEDPDGTPIELVEVINSN